MKIKAATASACRKCLVRSLELADILRFARKVIPNYDIYERMGLSEKLPLADQTAAARLIQDLDDEGLFFTFVELLIEIARAGFMGKKYQLLGLEDLIDCIDEDGYVFDRERGEFYESSVYGQTMNWARLFEGEERQMTFLRLDVVGNSLLVKKNPADKIKAAYDAINRVFTGAVVRRQGRVWSWEGDGALAAFCFGQQEKSAVFAGMEILNELWFFNRLENPLLSPVKVRMAAHVGKARYFADSLERLKNESVKQTVKLEGEVPHDSLGISYNLSITMDQGLLGLFGPEVAWGGTRYRLFQVETEGA
jgi:hypothetical protein